VWVSTVLVEFRQFCLGGGGGGVFLRKTTKKKKKRSGRQTTPTYQDRHFVA
jgi:hypothetical protein